MIGSEEKRRHPRVHDRLTLRSFFETGSVEMATTNLSLGGAHVVTGRFMPLMTRVEVTLHLPPEVGVESRPRPVKAEAVVVRVEPPSPDSGAGSFEMALFFSRMEQQDRAALARYLAIQSQAR